MPRKRFQNKQNRRGAIGVIFPYSTSRSGLIIRSLIIAIIVGLPLRITFVMSQNRANDTEAKMTPIIESIEQLVADIESEQRQATQEEVWLYRSFQAELKPYPKKMYMCAIIMAVCIGLSVVQFILSIWMLVIPRLRDMGQSPKLAWLMIIPGANVILPWFLILAPSR